MSVGEGPLQDHEDDCVRRADVTPDMVRLQGVAPGRREKANCQRGIRKAE